MMPNDLALHNKFLTACREKKYDDIDKLLPNITNINYRCPITTVNALAALSSPQLATRNRHFEIVKKIIKMGCDINNGYNNADHFDRNTTILINFCDVCFRKNNYDYCEYLEYTDMIYEFVKLLIDNGANVKVIYHGSGYYYTPFTQSLNLGSYKVSRLILESGGCDVEDTNINNIFLTHMSNISLELMEIMLCNGLNIYHPRNKSFLTACDFGREDIAMRLFDLYEEKGYYNYIYDGDKLILFNILYINKMHEIVNRLIKLYRKLIYSLPNDLSNIVTSYIVIPVNHYVKLS